jgi:hypothetical protein
MTDVIRGQQESTRAVCILAPENADMRYRAEDQSHQQPASAIKSHFHFSLWSVSQSAGSRKVIFSG